jgi:uncharacterized membrane protein
MPRIRERSKERESRNQIASTVKKRFVLLISLLSAILLVMMFRVGAALWPLWVVEHRLRIVAILLLIIICSIVLLPIMIEATSNTQTLSGPGKNPKGPHLE